MGKTASSIGNELKKTLARESVMSQIPGARNDGKYCSHASGSDFPVGIELYKLTDVGFNLPSVSSRHSSRSVLGMF